MSHDTYLRGMIYQALVVRIPNLDLVDVEYRPHSVCVERVVISVLVQGFCIQLAPLASLYLYDSPEEKVKDHIDKQLHSLYIITQTAQQLGCDNKAPDIGEGEK